MFIGDGCGHWTDYPGDVESEGSSRTEGAGKHDDDCREENGEKGEKGGGVDLK